MTSFWVGTSGYSYKEWIGPFYPPGLPARGMLAFYGDHFRTVEINNSFYRMPSPALLRPWAAAVSEGFRFVFKAPRRITHQRRTGAEIADDVARLCEVTATLAGKLGPILFQLPPYAKVDLDLLSTLLAALPRGQAAAFEFRHPSWQSPDVYALLRGQGAALCYADVDGTAAPAELPVTAPWGYVRLRRTQYDSHELAAWTRRLRAPEWREVYVFFKHEGEGLAPRLARDFIERLQEPERPAAVRPRRPPQPEA